MAQNPENSTTGANQPKQSKGLRRWIAGGMLTAIAAGTFVAVAPNFRQDAKDSRPVPTAVAEGKKPAPPAEETIPDEKGLFPAATQDRKMVRVYMDIHALNGGNNDVIKALATNAIMQSVSKIDSKDLAQNADAIQKFVQSQLEQTPLRADGGYLKQGTDFSAPKISRITDVYSKETLYKANGVTPALKALGL